MSVKETPLATVKRIHGSKEKLVDSLVPQIAKDSDESKAELKERLMCVSNKKLLRLSAAFQQMQEKYGSKSALIDALSKGKGKDKDEDFKVKLADYSIPRLLDMTRDKNRPRRRK